MRRCQPAEIPSKCMHTVSERSGSETQSHAVACCRFLPPVYVQEASACPRGALPGEKAQATFLCSFCILPSCGDPEKLIIVKPCPCLLGDPSAGMNELICGCASSSLLARRFAACLSPILDRDPWVTLWQSSSGSFSESGRAFSESFTQSRPRILLAKALRLPANCRTPCWPAPMDPGLKLRAGMPMRHLMSAQR